MIKYILLTFTLSLGILKVTSVFSQGVLGEYEQETISAPKGFKPSEHDVVIVQDPQASKKVWISNLIPDGKIYAIVDTKADTRHIYVIPKQKVGNYQIEIGCIMYDDDDKRMIISLNSKSDCDFSMKEFENISVGKDGVKAGNIVVGSNGNVSTDNVNVDNKGNVNVNMKGMFEGLQYIGHKKGHKKEDED